MNKYFILSALAIIIFTSCQKETSIENGTSPASPPIPSSNDSILLSKYIELDTTSLPTFDTLSITLFYYDNLKRNTSINLLEYQNGIVSNYQYYSVFYYSGNDTVPYKKTVITPNFLPSDPGYLNDTCYYFYTNSKLESDSSISTSIFSPSTTVNRYTYNANGIIHYSTYYAGGVTTETYPIYLQRTAGNITSQRDTPSVSLIKNFVYLYDTHPNPFSKTQNKIAIDNRFPFYYMETFPEEVFEKNNVTEVNQLEGTYNFHYRHFYEYKSNGYPKVVRSFDQNDPTNFYKGIFVYTN